MKAKERINVIGWPTVQALVAELLDAESPFSYVETTDTDEGGSQWEFIVETGILDCIAKNENNSVTVSPAATRYHMREVK